MKNKIKALADFLGESVKNLRDNGDNCYQVADGLEYLVLTDEEADEQARTDIEDSLWAFNSEFILDTCELDSDPNVTNSLRKMRENSCEGCNDFIRAIVDGTCGIYEFVAQAILADGRGQFLSTYDGEEGEQDGHFIYCIG